MTQEELQKEKRENRFYTLLFLSPFILLALGIAGYNGVNYIKQQKEEKLKQNIKQSAAKNAISFIREYDRLVAQR